MAVEAHEAVTAERPEDIEAVPVRHPWRWVAAAVVLVLAVTLAHSVATNPRFGWHTVGSYLFDHRVIAGLILTIELTVVSMIVGILLGVTLAVMRQSPNPLVSGGSWLYIWFFRGTPVFVQIFFWYFIADLYPKIALGIPFGPQFVHINASSFFKPFVVGILALGLNEGAYMAEIVRAGFLAVDPGQTEAAQALGMRRGLTLRRVVLPQAMRVIIPPTGNETISMLKTSSLVSAVAIVELLYSVQQIYDVNYRTIPLLIVASLWYLALTSLLYVGQYYIERHYGRGTARADAPTLLARILRGVGSLRREGVASG